MKLRKVTRGPKEWALTALSVLLLIVCVPVPQLHAAQDNTNQQDSGKESPVSISDITQNPEEHKGKRVTIGGEVESVWSDRSVRIGGVEFYGDEMIVTSLMPIPKVTQRGEQRVLKDDLIVASGVVKIYRTIDDAKAELGQLSPNFESGWAAGQPILVADTILVVPRKQDSTSSEGQTSSSQGSGQAGSTEQDSGRSGSTGADTSGAESMSQDSANKERMSPDADDYGADENQTPVDRLGDTADLQGTTADQMGNEGTNSAAGAGQTADTRYHTKVGKNTFSKWDTSNDKELSYDEVRQGLRTTGHFQKWDRNSDGELDEDELAHGLTQALDKDKDNSISLAEYHAGWAYLKGNIDADRTTQPTRQTE